MAKTKRPKYRQLTLDGIPINLDRPKRQLSGEIAPFMFKDQPLHAQMQNGEPWFVAMDACKVLEIKNTSDAVRGRMRVQKHTGTPYWSGGLDADEWGIGSADTPSGKQEVLLVNEFGLYALIAKSRTKNAKEFQRWVRHEVLPSISRTGSYSLKSADRVLSTQRRLRCDKRTAKNREEQRSTNVSCHADLHAQGAKRNTYMDWNNAPYEGMYGGMTARDLRRTTNRKGSPLEWSGGTNLAVNTLSKTITLQIAQEKKIPPVERAELLRRVAQEVARSSPDQFGPEFAFGITEHPERGRILDVVRVQLPAPKA